jgi:pectin methylesterase-like acyl-CoA thioesterase
MRVVTPRLQLALIGVAVLAMSACATSDDMPAAGSGGSAGGTTGTAGSSGAAGAGAGTAGLSGSAGSGGSTSGAAGQTGSAGTIGTGTAGASGGTAGGGVAGAGGAAGATGGAAGRGGTGGAAGRGGTGGVAGRGGTGGGTAGAAAGRGGTMGAAGQGGSAGTAGSAAGTGGTSARGGAGGTMGQGGQGNLPGGVTALFPPPNGQNLCPDPPLKITFSGTPTVGSSGLIRVFTSGGSVVATIDVNAASLGETIGGMMFTVSKPVFVDGNTVSITLPPKALGYGMTYYVNVASGAITGPGGAFSITDTNTWRFTTMAAAPSNKTAISVALDGSGSFCSVQGAFDLVPANNTAATTITVGTGNYHEIIRVNAKSNTTLQGADRNGTVISQTNNNNLNPSTKGRSLFGVDSSNTVTIRNLTIKNLTPQGGSQAEALRMESCDKCVVRDATVISLQDTLLWSGRIYANNVLIEGNVDYVWGTGAAYFVNSEIRTIGRSGVLVQARNTASTYGYVFVDSKLTADSASTSNNLARIDASVYAASHVAYINCQMTSVSAVGWQLTAGSATSALRFWEYKSVDASGKAINVGSRLAGSQQISDSQATMMRDPTVVLAGWQPPAN